MQNRVQKHMKWFCKIQSLFYPRKKNKKEKLISDMISEASPQNLNYSFLEPFPTATFAFKQTMPLQFADPR